MEGIRIGEQLVGFNSDIVHLKVDGFIDTSTSIELASRLKQIVQRGLYNLVIDLSGVNYVSSAGWGVFVGEIKDVREKGGDIKLVNMTPDVADVFHMLEFDKILHAYDSVEEAINEFDVFRGYDITHSPVKILTKSVSTDQRIDSLQKTETLTETDIQRLHPRRAVGESVPNQALLPITEKIKRIVANNPLLSVWGIRKELRSQEFGNTKIGFFRLMRLLKELDLDSKEKRYRFYRSR